MRRFEISDDGSSKFWHAWTEGVTLYTRFGKLGSSGQTKLKKLGSAALAAKALEAAIAQKVNGGYVELKKEKAARKVVESAERAPEKKAKATPPRAVAAAPAAGGRVVLDEETAKSVLPRHPAPADPRSVAELYEVVAAAFQTWWKETGSRFNTKSWLAGYREPEELRRFMARIERVEKVRAQFEAKQITKRDARCEADYGFELWRDSETVALYWANAMGGAFAIRAYAWGFDVDSGVLHRNLVAPQQEHPKYPVARIEHRMIIAMRKAIAQLDAKEFAAAKEAAEAIRAEAPLALRCALSAIIPDTWTTADVDDVTGGRDPEMRWLYLNGEASGPLLSATSDVEVAERIADFLAKGKGSASEKAMPFASSLLPSLGAKAHAPLAKLLDASGVSTRKDAARIMACIASPEAARSMANLLEDRSKDVRKRAADYASLHAEIARPVLEELIAKKAKVAEAAKRVLASLGSSNAEPAKETDSAKTKRNGMPDFARDLPALMTKSKKALPDAAKSDLIAMLAKSTIDAPHAGLGDAKKTCEPSSLAELGWALFQSWMLAGANPKDDWALLSLAHLGDDETVRRLTRRVREWPGEGAHARAVKALDVFAAIGSDLALSSLDGIAEKLKFKGLQDKAREKIEAVAKARGLTRDELADRIAPTLDLDADGSRKLSFGRRSFKVGFDEHLEPFVIDEAGKKLADLPKPGKTDDEAAASDASQTWRGLKKDAKAVARAQCLRLERAMCIQRRWSKKEFEAGFLVHPLVSHLTRRLLWAHDDGNAKTFFRVAEDRTLAREDDAIFTLPSAGDVRIAHALDLDDATRGDWEVVFAEYEIIQPFAQLARETFAPTKSEAKKSVLERFQGTKIPTGRVMKLEDRGWRRGTPGDAGWIWDMQKALPHGVIAEIALGGGILARAFSESPEEQELGTVSFVRDSKAVSVASLDPIVFSEIVRDVGGDAVGIPVTAARRVS